MKNREKRYPNTIKEHRSKVNLMQKELAVLMGIPKSTDRLSLWETGQKMPSAQNLIKLCKLLHASAAELYPGL